MADSTAWRPVGSGAAGRSPHPTRSNTKAGRDTRAVILALILLSFRFVHRRSAPQAFMFTLNLDLCGTQITKQKRSLHPQLSPVPRPLHAVPPRLAPQPSRFGVRLLRYRDPR